MGQPEFSNLMLGKCMVRNEFHRVIKKIIYNVFNKSSQVNDYIEWNQPSNSNSAWNEIIFLYEFL